MKKIWLYYLIGIMAFFLLAFPNLIFSDADAEMGPLQSRWLTIFVAVYLSGMAFIFRHALLRSVKQFWVCWIGALIIIFPLGPLFNINGGYYNDWYNHLWMVGYYGEYFSVHKTMPAVLNTNQTLLIAYPTFYGYLLYAVLGLLSAYTGANIAVRIGILVLWIMKFALAYRATNEVASFTR